MSPSNATKATVKDQPAVLPTRNSVRDALSFRSISAVYIFVALFIVFSLWVPGRRERVDLAGQLHAAVGDGSAPGEPAISVAEPRSVRDAALMDQRRWAKLSEVPLTIAAVIFLAAYSTQVLAQPPRAAARWIQLVRWLTWAAFLIDLPDAASVGRAAGALVPSPPS